jgi:hypothetical protein
MKKKREVERRKTSINELNHVTHRAFLKCQRIGMALCLFWPGLFVVFPVVFSEVFSEVSSEVL